jgi:hypothetical protein
LYNVGILATEGGFLQLYPLATGDDVDQGDAALEAKPPQFDIVPFWQPLLDHFMAERARQRMQKEAEACAGAEDQEGVEGLGVDEDEYDEELFGRIEVRGRKKEKKGRKKERKKRKKEKKEKKP